MLTWLKQRLIDWADQHQRREILRLQKETIRLKEELERQTGQPVQLTPDKRRKLAKKAQGIDPEILKQILVFDLDAPIAPPDPDSAENP